MLAPWKAAGMTSGFLCIGCLERRIGTLDGLRVKAIAVLWLP